MRFLFDVNVNDQIDGPFCFDHGQNPEPGPGSASDCRWLYVSFLGKEQKTGSFLWICSSGSTR